MKVNARMSAVGSTRHGPCTGCEEFYSPVAQWQSERLFTVRSVVRIHPGEPNSGKRGAHACRSRFGAPLPCRTAGDNQDSFVPERRRTASFRKRWGAAQTTMESGD